MTSNSAKDATGQALESSSGTAASSQGGPTGASPAGPTGTPNGSSLPSGRNTEKLPLDPSSQRIIATKNLALMAFMTVWGFGNVINGYAVYNGVGVIFTWILMFTLYFVPYALMVGEMGSAFRNEGGGVSSWVEKGFNKKLAYYAGWTYWVVHMPYISQKPLNIIVATSWGIWGDKRASSFDVRIVQIICIAIFALVVIMTLLGVRMVKTICSIAGVAGLVMSLLFIIMAISAPMLRNVEYNNLNIGIQHYLPRIDFKYLTSICILVFAVGGCEKISPYVNKMKEPSKGFPRGIIFMTVMVVFTAIVGTIALALMFDPVNPPEDIITNGAYEAFQKLGNWYGMGDIFVKLYALSIVIAQFGVMMLSIDAPLRIMIESTDPIFIPSKLRKTNKFGSYYNGIILMSVIVTILLIIPMFGIGQVNEMVKWLIKLNAVCMPMRYLWVFVAYIGLKKMGPSEAQYLFTKNKVFGIVAAAWCFGLTAMACSLGVISDTPFKTTINLITPIVLITLGLIMPYFARRERATMAEDV